MKKLLVAQWLDDRDDISIDGKSEPFVSKLEIKSDNSYEIQTRIGGVYFNESGYWWIEAGSIDRRATGESRGVSCRLNMRVVDLTAKESSNSAATLPNKNPSKTFIVKLPLHRRNEMAMIAETGDEQGSEKVSGFSYKRIAK